MAFIAADKPDNSGVSAQLPAEGEGDRGPGGSNNSRAHVVPGATGQRDVIYGEDLAASGKTALCGGGARGYRVDYDGPVTQVKSKIDLRGGGLRFASYSDVCAAFGGGCLRAKYQRYLWQRTWIGCFSFLDLLLNLLVGAGKSCPQIAIYCVITIRDCKIQIQTQGPIFVRHRSLQWVNVMSLLSFELHLSLAFPMIISNAS